MQQVVFLLLIGLVLIQADSLLEMDAHCAEECGSPEYDELVKELDHQDEVLNDLVTRAVNVEHSLDQSKKEHDDADRESRNLLLRLDRLHSDKEHDVCPKKHRKCLTSAARDGKPCVANILVCDGEEDCLDGSDEDPELCTFPVEIGNLWYGDYQVATAYIGLTPIDARLKFEHIERSETLKSYALVVPRIYFSYKGNDDSIFESSIVGDMIYHFGTRSGIMYTTHRGNLLKRHMYFDIDKRVIYYVGYSPVSEEKILSIIFKPYLNKDVEGHNING